MATKKFGVTPQGFRIRRLADVLERIDTDLRAEFGPDVRLGPDSVLGVLRGAFAMVLAEAWEALGQIVASFDVDQAEGVQLDALCAMINMEPRLPAIPSTGSVTLTGTSGTRVPAGTRIRGAASGVVVETVALVELVGGSATVGVRSVQRGPFEAAAGDLTVIINPVSGWSSVTNPDALVPGRLEESDLAMRVRREASLLSGGAGTVHGIRAALLALPEVQQCVVINNPTPATLASGQAPWSGRCVLWPDTADPEVEGRIGRVLQDQLRLAGRIWGEDASVTLTDDDGQSRAYAWDYADAVPIYVEIDLTVSGTAPSDLADSVRAAVELWLNGRSVGESIGAARIAAIAVGVSNRIVNAAVRVGTASSPTGTLVTIDDDQIARAELVTPVIV